MSRPLSFLFHRVLISVVAMLRREIIKGVPHEEVQKSIKEALETVGLWHVAHKRVGEFSGGMKRRTSVAIASIGDPKIMFLDEPTTGMARLSPS